jgi:hypothetical protein
VRDPGEIVSERHYLWKLIVLGIERDCNPLSVKDRIDAILADLDYDIANDSLLVVRCIAPNFN